MCGVSKCLFIVIVTIVDMILVMINYDNISDYGYYYNR